MNAAQDFDDEVPQGAPMAETVASPALIAPAAPSRFQQFYVLTKPRVVQLIVFCALIGMALAVPGVPTAAEAFKIGRAHV